VVCLHVKLCDPHLSALEVRFSRRGAIQIYVYRLPLPTIRIKSLPIGSSTKRNLLLAYTSPKCCSPKNFTKSTRHFLHSRHQLYIGHWGTCPRRLFARLWIHLDQNHGYATYLLKLVLLTVTVKQTNKQRKQIIYTVADTQVVIVNTERGAGTTKS